jgi:hypothetical protein
MIENSRNKARMSMKTKDRFEEFTDWGPVRASRSPLSSRRSSKARQIALLRWQFRCRTPKVGEQSENVYENKRRPLDFTPSRLYAYENTILTIILPLIY